MGTKKFNSQTLTHSKVVGLETFMFMLPLNPEYV